MRPEQIPYGVKEFKRVRLENFRYVDKSAFIEKLAQRADFLFFVRPRLRLRRDDPFLARLART